MERGDAVCEFAYRLAELQALAEQLGLSPVAVQLTGGDDHMTLRAGIDALSYTMAHASLTEPGVDILGGVKIYPAHHRRNGTRT